MRKQLDLIDTATAAPILRLSRSQVNRRAAAGEIPVALRAPGLRGAYLFDRSVIEQVAAARAPQERAS